MTLANSKFGTAQPVKRREDTRFLTGDGRYLDDTAPANALYAYVFRSSVAHAEITTLDVSDADFPAIGEAFAETGKEITGRVGSATVHLMRARDVVDFGTDWITRNRGS